MAIAICIESKSFKFEGDNKVFMLISDASCDGAYVLNYYGASISRVRARNLVHKQRNRHPLLDLSLR